MKYYGKLKAEGKLADMTMSEFADYYRETEPARRKEMLAQLCESLPEDGAGEYRKQLLTARHTDPARPGHEVDRMLFMCVSFIQMYKSARLFAKGTRKDVLTAMKEMGFERARDFGEAGEEALYQEIRNAAARYFKTCESASYNRRLFGLAASGEENRKNRMCRDAWQMSEGLATRTGLTEEMKIWNRGVLDAFAATGEGAREMFRAFGEKNQ